MPNDIKVTLLGTDKISQAAYDINIATEQVVYALQDLNETIHELKYFIEDIINQLPKPENKNE